MSKSRHPCFTACIHYESCLHAPSLVYLWPRAPIGRSLSFALSLVTFSTPLGFPQPSPQAVLHLNQVAHIVSRFMSQVLLCTLYILYTDHPDSLYSFFSLFPCATLSSHALLTFTIARVGTGIQEVNRDPPHRYASRPGEP